MMACAFLKSISNPVCACICVISVVWSAQVSEMMLKKYLAEAQQHTFMTLVQVRQGHNAHTMDGCNKRPVFVPICCVRVFCIFFFGRHAIPIIRSWPPRNDQIDQYDHAYTLESRTERMDVLTSALWRGVFMSDESIKEPHVRVLAEYIDTELADIYAVDAVRGQFHSTGRGHRKLLSCIVSFAIGICVSCRL